MHEELDENNIYTPDYEDGVYHQLSSRHSNQHGGNPDKSLPPYKHSFSYALSDTPQQKLKWLDVKLEGSIYSHYKLQEKTKTEKKDFSQGAFSLDFGKEHIAQQITIALKTGQQKLIDLGSGFTVNFDSSLVELNDDGDIKFGASALTAKGILTKGSPDSKLKSYFTQRFGDDLFEQKSVIELTVSIQLRGDEVFKEVSKKIKAQKEKSRELLDESKTIEEDCIKLEKERIQKRDAFIQNEIIKYEKHHHNYPDESWIKNALRKFQESKINKSFKRQIQKARDKIAALKDEISRISGQLKRFILKHLPFLGHPVVKKVLRFFGAILSILGGILDMIETIRVAFNLAHDIMKYGVNFGFNPLAILGMEEKGPGYTNAPLYVKGSGESSHEVVENSAMNLIMEAGEGDVSEMPGNKGEKGNQGGRGTNTDGGGNRENPVTNEREKRKSPQSEKKQKGSSTKETKTTKLAHEKEEKLHTIYELNPTYEYNKELKGPTKTVNIFVYADEQQYITPDSKNIINLTVEARIDKNKLCLVYFENVEAFVFSRQKEGITENYIIITESMIAVGEKIKMELAKNKVYKLHAHE